MRARLLAAGERVFAAKGYEGARLSDIAEEAGCSVGAVYFRFKDKDALFFAIAEAFAEEARLGLARRLARAAGADARETIRRFVADVARTMTEHRGLFRAIVERGFDRPLATETVFKLRDELAHGLEIALRGEAPNGPSLPVRVMTQMVYGFLLAAVLNKRASAQADPETIAELAKAASAYLLAGEDGAANPDEKDPQ